MVLRQIRFLALGLTALLTGCILPVDYGKIPHADYVKDPRCNPEKYSDINVTDKMFFVVTSRLPDCRADDLKLLSHRGDRVRYGRFGAPADALNAKGKSVKRIPFVLAGEAHWWTDLSRVMGNGDGRVLLYVHGFKETFFTSSRDTAQIARLSNFEGPVIQYSWPSQGQFFKYAVDETNMYWDERNFRKFLMKLAQQPWAKEIILVSHSLGARLVLPAVEYVDRNSAHSDSSNISNIILASPDIDRQDFERDLAEEILSARRVNNDRRITVYTSAGDKALGLSADIHGYPRLGSPRCFDPYKAAELKQKGLPQRCYAAKSDYNIAPGKIGLTIIDTTAVSRGRSGHSDYLRSTAACRDFAAVVKGERSRKDGRIPTHLSHVFKLAEAPKGQKPDDMALCQREDY
ncbi:putative lipoprotein [hydrothermal vent metagenome]|uniref:Putative lipoprotein n=1 Tax=hydrothermal vent metagenome TaxID=652676 RepID=A0A3B0TD27_9ZZZZ